MQTRVLTLILKFSRSSGIIVSALATTGIKLTLLPNLFMISTSSGFTLLAQLTRGGNCEYSRQSTRLQEVQARVDSEILLLGSHRLLLLTHVRLVLIINEVHNRRPATRQPGSDLLP